MAAKAPPLRTFYVTVLALLALKLWLTSGIRILPAFGPHDASNFLEHARSLARGHWFGRYNDLTLIKQPFFPIYMAIVQDTGLPLTVAHLLLDGFACFIACIAVRPMIRSQAVLAVIFAILYFNPFSYDILAWVTYRSQVNPALALLTVSCAFALFVRRHSRAKTALPWAIGFGASLSAFWLTREEAVWIAPALLGIAAAYFWWLFRYRRVAIVPRLVLVAIPLIMLGTSVTTIKVLNGLVYGWFVTNEQQAPEFVSAYGSLARIDVPPEQYFPVPRSARLIAYSVSPAARELQPFLEGALGQGWNAAACDAIPQVCGKPDIGGGWFLWALRDAVSLAGHYTSGADARAFYIRLSSEIDAACDAGTIKCRRKTNNVFPAVRLSEIPAISATFVSGFQLLADFGNLDLNPWKVITSGALRGDYTFVVREVADDRGSRQFIGWLAHRPIKSIEVIGPGSDSAQIAFFPSPDIDRNVITGKNVGLDGGLARFEIDSFCEDSCTLKVVDYRNTTTLIPLNGATNDFSAPGFVFHLDSDQPEPVSFTDPFKTAALNEIARTYKLVFGYALALAAVLIAFRLVRVFRHGPNRTGEHVILAFSAGASVLALLLLLSIIGVIAFPAFSPEYMGAMMPLLLLIASVSTAVEGTRLLRLLSRKLPKTIAGPAVAIQKRA